MPVFDKELAVAESQFEIMKAVFAMSLVSAVLSLAAVFGFCAMTIVPRPGVETFRMTAIGVVSMFFLAWLAVAFWARTRQRADAAPVPGWLRSVLLVASAVYSLGIILGMLP